MARGPTVVLNQLGPEAGRAIAALDPRLEVLDDAQGLPWTRAGEADILLTAPRNGWRDAPRTPPPGWPCRLQWVHTASVGVDYFAPWLFDVPQVTCARGVAAVPIAEFVMAALLAHVRPLAYYCASEPASWHSGFGRISASPPVLLAGQTLGLVGFGAIGQAVARRALAHARAGLHLINIARGGLVDHDALLAALDAGRLSGATLDVTDPEPLPAGHALYTHARVRLTPHISWAAGDVGATSTHKFLDNLKRYLDARPLRDVVEPARGY